MLAYVFTDKSLERYAGRFVWLSVNTEDSKNANFLWKYPIRSLPTLLVLDPSGDKIVMRYVGGATLPQLEKMLDDASKKTQSRSDALVASAETLAPLRSNGRIAPLFAEHGEGVRPLRDESARVLPATQIDALRCECRVGR